MVTSHNSSRRHAVLPGIRADRRRARPWLEGLEDRTAPTTDLTAQLQLVNPTPLDTSATPSSSSDPTPDGSGEIARVLQAAGLSAQSDVLLASAGYDLFLKIDGIAGESNVRGHEHQIELASMTWGCSRPITAATGHGVNREAAAPAFDEIQVTMRTSSATPNLFRSALVGTGKVMELAVRKTGTDGDFLVWKLENTLVSGMKADGVQETVTLNFTRVTLEYRTTDAKGTVTPIRVSYDLATARAAAMATVTVAEPAGRRRWSIKARPECERT
ncbi:MAG: type VI secretion system tube protein Hcp [Gemmataceae bacterium]